jgi:hypothetical protein
LSSAFLLLCREYLIVINQTHNRIKFWLWVVSKFVVICYIKNQQMEWVQMNSGRNEEGVEELKEAESDKSLFLENLENVLTCFISRRYMRHPVFASDGFCYELEQLLKWFRAKNKAASPRHHQLITSITEAYSLTQALDELENSKAISDRYEEYDKASALTKIREFLPQAEIKIDLSNEIKLANREQVNGPMPRLAHRRGAQMFNPNDFGREAKTPLSSFSILIGTGLALSALSVAMHLYNNTDDPVDCLVMQENLKFVSAWMLTTSLLLFTPRSNVLSPHRLFSCLGSAATRAFQQCFRGRGEEHRDDDRDLEEVRFSV